MIPLITYLFSHWLPNDTRNHIHLSSHMQALLESVVGRVEGNSLPLVALENKQYINLANVSCSFSIVLLFDGSRLR